MNITSLHVAPTARAGLSELTCVVHADRIDDAKRSLSKLIEVIDVREVHDSQADGVP
jgi:acetolactate synthase small subunit